MAKKRQETKRQNRDARRLEQTLIRSGQPVSKPEVLPKPSSFKYIAAQKPKVSLKGLVGFSITAIGVAAGVVTFLPRVTVTHADPVDSTNPLSVTFTIRNTTPAPITLHDVNARLVLNFVTEGMKLNIPKKLGRGPGSLTRPEWQDITLQPDESFTVTPELLFSMAPGVKAGAGDVAVVVDYKPGPLPFHREVAFRFTTQHHENGSLTWYSIPME